MARWLQCSMQSSSLGSHLLQKTQPTEAAWILSYTGYSCVHSPSQAGFVSSVALWGSRTYLDPSLDWQSDFFKSICEYCESGKPFWTGNQWNLSGFHSALLASNHIQVTYNLGNLWFLSVLDTAEQHWMGHKFNAGGPQVPSGRSVLQWSHGSDSIMALTKVRSLRGMEALEYL